MAARVVFDGRDYLEAEARIKQRRLKAVGGQHDLRATAAPHLIFHGLQQARAQPSAAPRCIDPELTYLTATAPGSAADAGDNARASRRFSKAS